MTMLELILKSYFDLFVSVGVACAVIFLIGVVMIFIASKNQHKIPKVKTAKKAYSDQSSPSDIDTIAGDDVVSTQLDLARAFIETNQGQSAKQILQHVLQNGTETQKSEANQLLGLM